MLPSAADDADRLALHQARIRQALEHPGEDRLVRLNINQATRPRNRRMIRRRLRQRQSEKLAQGKRIGRPPGDRALRIQSFEIPDQQEPEITSRWQPWPAVIRVESLAQAFDVAIEVVLLRATRTLGTTCWSPGNVSRRFTIVVVAARDT